MSAQSPTTRIEELGELGSIETAAFFISPPITEREWAALNSGLNDGYLTREEQRVLDALENEVDMDGISRVDIDMTINGDEGSLLIVEADDGPSQITVAAAFLGQALSTLRGQGTFELALNPQRK